MCNMTFNTVLNFMLVSLGIYVGLALIIVIVSSILERLCKTHFDIDKASIVFAILYLIVEFLYVYYYYR